MKLASLVTCGLLLSLAPVALRAQTGSVIIARVTDAEADRPLVGAQLRVAGASTSARSDSAGVARLVRVPGGQHVVEVRRVGYEPATLEVTLSGADTLDLAVALERAPRQLDTVTVTERAPVAGLEAFEARRARGLGQFLTPDLLDAEGGRELGDVLASRLRGVRVVTGRDGVSRYVVSPRVRGAGALLGGSTEDQRRTSGRLPPGACVMHVYLDGVFVSDYDVSFIDTRSVAAVEAYGAAAPAQYRRAGSDCGVVLLWTRLAPD